MEHSGTEIRLNSLHGTMKNPRSAAKIYIIPRLYMFRSRKPSLGETLEGSSWRYKKSAQRGTQQARAPQHDRPDRKTWHHIHQITHLTNHFQSNPKFQIQIFAGFSWDISVNLMLLVLALSILLRQAMACSAFAQLCKFLPCCFAHVFDCC